MKIKREFDAFFTQISKKEKNAFEKVFDEVG